MVQRVGSRGAVADVARSLCAKLAPTLLAPATVAALAETALAAAREDAGPDFVRAVLGLLVDAAAAAPTLFSGLLGPVRRSSRVLREPLLTYVSGLRAPMWPHLCSVQCLSACASGAVCVVHTASAQASWGSFTARCAKCSPGMLGLAMTCRDHLQGPEVYHNASPRFLCTSHRTATRVSDGCPALHLCHAKASLMDLHMLSYAWKCRSDAQVTELLHADEAELQAPGIKADLTLAATRVLAAAGAAMRDAAPAGLAPQAERLQGALLQLCRAGPPKAAKAGVRCAAGLAALCHQHLKSCSRGRRLQQLSSDFVSKTWDAHCCVECALWLADRAQNRCGWLSSCDQTAGSKTLSPIVDPSSRMRFTPRALVSLRGTEAAAAVLEPLCAQLARRLAKPGATADPTLPAALQALSSVGRMLPGVFAPHAQAVCAFVTQACHSRIP